MEGGGYGEGRGLMHGKDGYGLNGYSQEKEFRMCGFKIEQRYKFGVKW